MKRYNVPRLVFINKLDRMVRAGWGTRHEWGMLCARTRAQARARLNRGWGAGMRLLGGAIYLCAWRKGGWGLPLLPPCHPSSARQFHIDQISL